MLTGRQSLKESKTSHVTNRVGIVLRKVFEKTDLNDSLVCMIPVQCYLLHAPCSFLNNVNSCIIAPIECVKYVVFNEVFLDK